MFILKAEAINLEIGLFLRELKSFLGKSQNEENTALNDTLTAVSLLLSGYEKQTLRNSNKNDIRHFMKDANIEIKRNAFCRCCNVSIIKNHSA